MHGETLKLNEASSMCSSPLRSDQTLPLL